MKKAFTVVDDTLETVINFYFNYTSEELNKTLREKTGCKFDVEGGEKRKDASAYHMESPEGESWVVVWMPKFSNRVADYALLAHEILHAVRMNLTDIKGIKYSEKTEEVFCKLLDFYFERAVQGYKDAPKK